jgi:hypothetical protein
MSSFEEVHVECKKDLKGRNDVILFQTGKKYLARVWATSAVVKDESGCFRSLYETKSDKFYKEYFKEIQIEDKITEEE